MKNNLQKIFICATFLTVFGFSANAFGQIRTGGYKSVAVSDAGVKAAADFAIELKSDDYDAEIRLENILKAETQTVAGTNFRLCLEIYVPAETDGEDGVQMTVQTIVYRNLRGEMKITNWNDESDCGGN